MRHPIYLSVLLAPMVIMTGCSIGHESHENGDEHHSEGGNQLSKGHADSHDDESDLHDSGIGKPGDVDSVDRVISVVMDDTMRFIHESFDVIAGETKKIDVENQGNLVHEFVLGSADEIKEHHELMLKFPGMESVARSRD